MNVGLLLYIMHNWLVPHRYYLAVCFWSASFRIPPSLRLFNTVVRRFAASNRVASYFDAPCDPQKGKDVAPKGGKKGKNKGQDKGGHKGKGKGKGNDRKG